MNQHPIGLGDLVRAFDKLAPTEEFERQAIVSLLWPQPVLDVQVLVDEKEYPPADVDKTAPEEKPDVEPQHEDELPDPPALNPASVVESGIEKLEPLSKAPPDWFVEVEPLEKDPPAPSVLPLEPLFVEPWVRGALTESLSTVGNEGAVDVDRVVEILARAEVLQDIPRKKVPTLRFGLQVLVDISEALFPYRRDQRAVLKKIEHVFGKEHVDILLFKDSPSLGVYAVDSKGHLRPYVAPPRETLVLLLTDLGIGRALFSQQQADPKAWVRFARRVLYAECPLVALVPYGRDRWPSVLKQEMKIMYWGRRSIPPETHPAAGAPPEPGEPVSEAKHMVQQLQRQNTHAAELAKLVSLAGRIEPELLRATRLQLLPESDAGAEADLWFSPLVESQSRLAMIMQPEVVQFLRSKLAAEENRLDDAWAALKAFRHIARTPKAIQLEEETTYLSLRYGAEATDRIEQLLRSAIRALVDKDEDRSGLALWAAQAIPSLPEEVRRTKTATELLYAAHLRLTSRIIPINGGFEKLEELTWLFPEDLPDISVGVSLTQEGLDLREPPSSASSHVLGDVPGTNPRVLIISWEEYSKKQEIQVQLQPRQAVTVQIGQGPITIHTVTGERYELRPLKADEEGRPAEKEAKQLTSPDFSRQQIFLCYSPEDAAEAERLRTVLTAIGYTVWWDQQIESDEDRYFAIRDAMDRSQALLVCLSEEAAAKMTYGVYPEVRQPLSHYEIYPTGTMALITVRFSDCAIPIYSIDEKRTLGQAPSVDLFPPENWREGIEHLLAALRQAWPTRPKFEETEDTSAPLWSEAAVVVKPAPPPPQQEHDITQILMDAGSGDERARNRLWDKVYEELYRIAQRELQRERPGHTLGASDLVHEAYLKLVDHTRITWRNRSHFYALSCEIMRRILIDYARRRSAGKRAGRKDQVPLDEALQMSRDRGDRLLALDEALERLSALDPRLGKVVECKFFGGLTTAETAQALGTSVRTVERDWRRARAYLHQALKS